MSSSEFERPDDRGPIAWMVNNRVTANLLMLALLVGGLITFFQIKQEVFPDFDLDIVNVSVPYPGASPEEIEKSIVQSIEESVRGVDGVKKVTSFSSEGMGSVSCELLTGADRQEVYQDIQQEVDRITTFPEDAERPRVSLVTRRRNVMTLVLYGNESEDTLRNLAEQIREELVQNKKITQVEIEGVRDREISIEVPQNTLRAYGLSLEGLAGIVDRASTELPAGGLKTAAGEILLRVKDRRDWGSEFAGIPVITTESGRQVRLGEIARIEDGFEDVDRFAAYNGQPAVLIEVYRIGDQTPLEVAAATRETIEDLNEKLHGVQLSVLRDWSRIYRERALLLGKNGLIGLTLVLVLLGLFLEARLAVWVAMGIPISFLGGLILLPGMGVSINMISMFAFLIAIGIVVDDAIVVGENVYEYHQRGVPFLKAAIQGAREVVMPVTFSVLTNIVAFLPLFFVPGFIGKIWRVIPAVVVAVFAVSLLECLYVLPSHLGHHVDRPKRGLNAFLHIRQQRFSDWFVKKIREVYGPILDRILAHRYVTMAIALALLLVTLGYVGSGRIGLIPMPRVEADFSVVTAALPYGSSVEQTRRISERLVQAARELGEEITRQDPGQRLQVTGVYTYLGARFRGISGGHVAEVRAYLADADMRPVQTREFTQRWRDRVGPLPGLDAILFEADRGGPGGGASLSIQLSHSDSEQLEKAATDTATWLAEFPNVSDIDAGFSEGKAQLDFKILPGGLNLGLTSRSIARQLRNAFYGAEALRQQRGRDEIKVRVRLPGNERGTEQDIRNLLVRTPAGTRVPLYEVAEATRRRAYTSIERKDGRRVLTMTANVMPVSQSENMLEAYLSEEFPRLQEKYPGLGYGLAGRQEDLSEGMAALKLGFIIAMLAIYVMLAVPFRSYVQPLIIMISIPFGIVGAVLGHITMGYSISMMSMMGMIALAGVVVNDSLVLIEYANRRRAEGLNTHDAMLNAGIRRFRPIILTTLTTFGGLAPMIFETSRQARFMIPMAISLGYGILFATGISLAIVPAMYMIVEDVQGLFAGKKGNSGTALEHLG